MAVWARFDVLAIDEPYVEGVKRLWRYDYRLMYKGVRTGRYQILRFRDDLDAAYYIRPIPAADDPNARLYTKQSCLPRVYRRLCDAKAAVEMMEVMGV
jgi:hypothetical protein